MRVGRPPGENSTSSLDHGLLHLMKQTVSGGMQQFSTAVAATGWLSGAAGVGVTGAAMWAAGGQGRAGGPGAGVYLHVERDHNIHPQQGRRFLETPDDEESCEPSGGAPLEAEGTGAAS